MQRVWMSLVPSLIAAVPLILIMICVGSQFEGQPQPDSILISDSITADHVDHSLEAKLTNADASEFTATTNEVVSNESANWPAWMQSWILIFIVASSASALAVRQWGGIV